MTVPREKRLIADYIAERFPNDHVIMGCPLGPVPESIIAQYGFRQAIRVARGIRPEVDALVIRKAQLVLVEAKIFKWLDGIAKLPVYGGLVTSTPELQPYRDLERRLILCTPWTSENVQAAANAQGVTIDIYNPPWIAAYVDETHKYWTKEYRDKRDEKMRLRKILGLE